MRVRFANNMLLSSHNRNDVRVRSCNFGCGFCSVERCTLFLYEEKNGMLRMRKQCGSRPLPDLWEGPGFEASKVFKGVRTYNHIIAWFLR